jgi:hypothetical protein
MGSGILVTADTIIWLSMCFAFAGPMILSGLYEALLDNRILEFLRGKIENQRLTLDMRCRCLMIILIGNLDLALEPELLPDRRRDRLPARTLLPPPEIIMGHLPTKGATETPSMDGTVSQADYSNQQPPMRLSPDSSNRSPRNSPPPPSRPEFDASPYTANLALERLSTPGERTVCSLDHDPQKTQAVDPGLEPQISRPGDENRLSTHSINRRPTAQMAASPWRHMEVLLYDIRLYDDDDSVRNESPRQWPRHRCEYGITCTNTDHVERPRPRDREKESFILKTKTRLRTMLHCQYSFGSVVGAPVMYVLSNVPPFLP